MPVIDGLELLRRLKAAGSSLPVIVMTGHGDVTLAVEAMKAGAVDFIEKPFDDDLFLRAIRSCVQNRSATESGAVATRLKVENLFASRTASPRRCRCREAEQGHRQ